MYRLMKGLTSVKEMKYFGKADLEAQNENNISVDGFLLRRIRPNLKCKVSNHRMHLQLRMNKRRGQQTEQR